jgi:hypothetical protein
LATIGVAFFSALTSVGALFYFEERGNVKNEKASINWLDSNVDPVNIL